MNKNNFKAFFKAITEMSLCFGGKLQVGRAKIYFNLLQEYPLEDVLKAIRVAEKRCKFFPSIAELREILGDATDTLGLQAWEKLRWAIKNYGADESVCFEDKGIHYVIEQMGGWIQLCETLLTKDAPFKQKEFERYYLYYLNHKDVDILATSIPSYLAGSTETSLRKNGYAEEDIVPPIDIEEKQKEQRKKEARDSQRRFLQSSIERPAIKYKQSKEIDVLVGEAVTQKRVKY
jgi:hypothetical protein